MTIRHLKIFLAVCDNDFNTTKASEEIHTTQPAVSLAIKELEQYYGVTLFDRIGRRLWITEGGRKFQEYARHIIALFDEMERGACGTGTRLACSGSAPALRLGPSFCPIM